MADPAAQDLFLGRQPILDRNQNLAAFELLFRAGHANRAHIEDDVFATATVINHAFSELGVEAVLGKHIGFINLSAPLLMSDVIELLPKNKVVLEILETVRVTDGLTKRCKTLKAMGFTLALDDFTDQVDQFRPLLDIVDIVKVDVQHMDEAKLLRTTRRLQELKVRLLAEKVDTREQVDRCLALGYELFQGYYFARPSVISGKRLSHAETALMRLLSLVLTDADTSEIESLFKQNPDLSVNLMKLVNSVAVGGTGKIHSLSRAITVLGRKQLQRWLQVLLFALGSAPNAEFPSPLLILAATRGKLMELIAESLRRSDKDFQDYAFMAGILSLVNALLGMPMNDILTSMPVEASVKGALLERSGLLGAMLLLVEALEEAQVESVEAAIERVPGLDHTHVMDLQVEAMRWANSIGEAA
ncbi:MAG TPA: EAL domain-containing protein [Burkholderiales bacterium]|nr:EAL domain-containing protein [Burkholderiales bacterium]